MNSFRRFIENDEQERHKTMVARIPLDPEVHLLKRTFHKADFDLVVVGGAVRDYLFHVHSGAGSKFKPKDIDLATNAPPEVVMDILRSPMARAKGIRSKPVGEAFGVIMAQVPRFDSPDDTKYENYEIATFREDIGKTGGHKPEDVKFGVTREEDAKRRDLTMNALMYDIPLSPNEEGLIHDYNGGLGFEDIEHKIARPVGDPAERFDEDPLRPMRLIRFFSRYNPGGPEVIERSDPKTSKALKEYSPLRNISNERIGQELFAGLRSSVNPVNFLKILHHFGYMDRIFGGLNVNPRVEQLYKLRNNEGLMRSPKIVMALLLKDNDGDQAAARLKTLAAASTEVDRFKLPENVKFLINLLKFDPSEVAQYSRQRERLRPEKGNVPFTPEMIDIHNQEIAGWAALMGLDMNIINRFAQFQRSVSGHDPRLAGVEGPDISKRMSELEAEKFRQSMSEKK